MHHHRASALALTALAAASAGCGSSEPRSATDVVRAWTEAVRQHDYRAATALFALPAVIDNGNRVQARRRVVVETFNRTLSCGAVLKRTAPAGAGRVVATFRLVRGLGGACSGTAQVRFRVEDGHITEWIRLDRGAPPDAQLT